MRKYIVGIMLIGVVLVLVGVAAPVEAYAIEGYTWRSKTITYYYDNFNSARAKNAFRDAATSWSNSTIVNLISGSAADYDIYCAEIEQINVEWDGAINYNTYGVYFTDATIYLNMGAYDTWNNTRALKSVAVHEFGHALGLAHYNGRVIMNPITWTSTGRYGGYNLTTPQQDDINGVTMLYTYIP